MADHAALIDESMIVRRVDVPVRDVVFFRGVIEASNGVAAVFAESGGELVVAGPRSRQQELDELLADLTSEFAQLESTSIG